MFIFLFYGRAQYDAQYGALCVEIAKGGVLYVAQ